METSTTQLISETNFQSEVDFLPDSSSSSSQDSLSDGNEFLPKPVYKDVSSEQARESLMSDSALEELGASTATEFVAQNAKPKNVFKDQLSFGLSVFNLMNVILGSGILGLAEAVKNLGLLVFIILLIGTALLASYTLNLLLHISDITKLSTYEGFGKLSFGLRGKVATSTMIILHCLGSICSYIFIIKNELPEVIKAFVNYQPASGETEAIYLNGDFLVILVMIIIIVPLSCFKEIKFLGFSSALGMICMIFFTITVIVKKPVIPCPLPDFENSSEPEANTSSLYQNASISSSIEIDDEQQTCEAKIFNLNSRTAYAVPTMMFAFMCHASMLPIYAELRRPSISRMQNVIFMAIFNVFAMYICCAVFGYLTFYNKVQSELLLTYSLYNSKDTMIVIARMMVLVCVTLSIPLLHYPARKTIILTLCRNPYQFSWFRHLLVMTILLTIAVGFVMFIPNIRDIFGMAGATTSTSLFVVFPSAFFIKLTGDDARNNLKLRYSIRRKIAWVMLVVGCIFMLTSIALILTDWLTRD